MTPAAQAEPVDLDGIRAGAERRIAELREQRQRLAPEALTSPAAAKKLAGIEAELLTAEQALERVDLAAVETKRREIEAREQAEQERRAEGLQRARELEAERRKAAAEVDKTARKFAEALKRWDEITTDQERALRHAGWSSDHAMSAARPRPWMIEAALRFAFASAHLPRGIIRLEPPGRGLGIQALADGDVRVIEPAEGER